MDDSPPASRPSSLLRREAPSWRAPVSARAASCVAAAIPPTPPAGHEPAARFPGEPRAENGAVPSRPSHSSSPASNGFESCSGAGVARALSGSCPGPQARRGEPRGAGEGLAGAHLKVEEVGALLLDWRHGDEEHAGEGDRAPEQEVERVVAVLRARRAVLVVLLVQHLPAARAFRRGPRGVRRSVGRGMRRVDARRAGEGSRTIPLPIEAMVKST